MRMYVHLLLLVVLWQVLVGLDEAEGRIMAVRGKFERQLQRLRERERLVEVSRQDCQTEEASLQGDRDRHRELMEQVMLLSSRCCCSCCFPRDSVAAVVVRVTILATV